MDTERLIECVKRHTFLYDVYHKEYKNVNLKTTIWELIGRELNQSGEAVKCKWKSIRDGYVKYKKQLQKAPGMSKKNVSYLWSSQLNFLDNYRAPASYVVNEPATPSSSFIHSREYENSQDYIQTLASNVSAILPLDNPETNVPSTSRERLKTNTRKKKKVDHADKVLKHIDKKKRKVDGIDHLFLSYAETFKKFPPKEQALLKLELAKLFSNTELRLLQPNTDESRASSSPAHSNSTADDQMTLQDILDADDGKDYCMDIKKEE